MRKINWIIFHCTATPQTAKPESILSYWRNTLGWKKPGYHHLILPDGTVMDLLPITEISNGVQGFNSDSINISYIGGVGPKGEALDNRTPQQLAAMERLARKYRAQFPQAKMRGHRDFSPDKNRDGVISPNEWLKTCPSFSVAAWLKQIGLALLLVMMISSCTTVKKIFHKEKQSTQVQKKEEKEKTTESTTTTTSTTVEKVDTTVVIPGDSLTVEIQDTADVIDTVITDPDTGITIAVTKKKKKITIKAAKKPDTVAVELEKTTTTTSTNQTKIQEKEKSKTDSTSHTKEVVKNKEVKRAPAIIPILMIGAILIGVYLLAYGGGFTWILGILKRVRRAIKPPDK